MVHVVRRWYERPWSRQATRVAGYALLTLTGVGAALWPPEALHAALGPVTYVWAAYMTLGGLCAALGAATDWWLGEFVGLPLVWTALPVWAFALILYADQEPYKATAALAITATAVLTWERWLDVRAAARAGWQVRDCETR